MAALRSLLRQRAVATPVRFLSAAAAAAAPTPYLELDEHVKPLSEHLAASPKALVYFTAAWCGPCRAIGPHFSALATQHGAAVRFIKVDVDANQGTAEEVRAPGRFAPAAPRRTRSRCPLPPAQAKVTSIPTFKSFKDGKVTASFTGAKAADLSAAVDKLLA